MIQSEPESPASIGLVGEAKVTTLALANEARNSSKSKEPSLRNETCGPKHSYDEIEHMIRTKLRRARQTNDSWIEKRASRNVLKFTMDLVEHAKVGQGSAVSQYVDELLKRDHSDRELSDGFSYGEIDGSVFNCIQIAIHSEKESVRAAEEQSVVDFALSMIGILTYDEGRETVHELAEKLRQEQYPA